MQHIQTRKKTSLNGTVPFLATLWGRWLQFWLGIVLLAAGITVMVRAEIGLGPWDVLHQGIAMRSDIAIGTASILVGFGIMVFWLPLGERPGFGTLLNIIFAGTFTNIFLGLVPPLPTLLGGAWLLPAQVVQMALGTLSLGIGSGLYVSAGLGAGPRDGVMMGLVRRTGLSVRMIRTGMEITALTIGWLLGGTLGLGTLIFAFGVGPVIQTTLRVARQLRGEPEPVATTSAAE
jgi:uncharacterized membrane protein YczE